MTVYPGEAMREDLPSIQETALRETLGLSSGGARQVISQVENHRAFVRALRASRGEPCDYCGTPIAGDQCRNCGAPND